MITTLIGLAMLPTEVGGIPTWVFNGLSVSGLVSFIIIGLATNRLWTRGQVDVLKTQHQEQVTSLKTQHKEQVDDLRSTMQGRVDDAIRREQEWRAVAERWQEVAAAFSDAVDPMAEQSKTILTIVQALQSETNVRRLGSRYDAR